VRLFALWLIGYYITTAPWFYVQAKKFSPDSALVYSLGAAAVVLAFSAVLWYSASWLAQRLISGPSQAAERSAAFDSWFSVGCALIGLWVLAKAIPALLHYFIATSWALHVPNTYIVTPDLPSSTHSVVLWSYLFLVARASARLFFGSAMPIDHLSLLMYQGAPLSWDARKRRAPYLQRWVATI
jgi:hypothetical protein